MKIQVVKTEQVTEINFHLNSRKAKKQTAYSAWSQLVKWLMKEGALQKAHVLLKDDVVAFTDNKRDIMTVLFKFLQIYCIIATESSLQLNQKKKKC